MNWIPPFLIYLDVGIDADERVIRSAYARKLKKIDVEKESESFQILRESYENALRWVRDPARMGAVESAMTAVESVTIYSEDVESTEVLSDELTNNIAPPEQVESVSYQPDVEANEVFSEFISTLAQPPHYLSRIKKSLENSLGDPRLINLEARYIFEWRLVCWLANGWRPGNEALIVIATTRFHWDRDRAHLHRFGWPGEIVEAAIHELTVFKQQDEARLDLQMDVLRKLRLNAPPNRGYLIKYMPLIEQIAASFPVFLPMIADFENVQRWRELESAIPEWRKRLANWRSGNKLEMNDKKDVEYSIWPALVYILILAIGFINFKGLPSGQPNIPSVEKNSKVPHEQNVLDERIISDLTREWANKIRVKVRSHIVIPKGTPLHAKTVYTVIQFEGVGEPIAYLKQSSGFPEYDEAIKRAVYASFPLPRSPTSQVLSIDLVLVSSP